jgi:hypothetical protein
VAAVAALCSCAICGVGALLIARHCRRRRRFFGLREEEVAAAAELSTAISSTQADAGVASDEATVEEPPVEGTAGGGTAGDRSPPTFRVSSPHCQIPIAVPYCTTVTT